MDRKRFEEIKARHDRLGFELDDYPDGFDEDGDVNTFMNIDVPEMITELERRINKESYALRIQDCADRESVAALWASIVDDLKEEERHEVWELCKERYRQLKREANGNE